MMGRSQQTWLGLIGLIIGLSVSACPTLNSETTCRRLCKSALICGVLPSALGSQEVDGDTESSIGSCVERCKSSISTDTEIEKIVNCLGRYSEPKKEPLSCTPTCDDMISCMTSAISSGEIGAQALGTSQLTITMLPANFWLSTKENTSWCPEQFDGAPTLAEIYENADLPAEVLPILELVRTSYDQLETELSNAADDTERLLVLDDFETRRYNNEILLPGSLIPRLRLELEAGGWQTSGLINGAGPGSCIKDQLYWSKLSIFGGDDLDTTESITARLQEEVSGEQSISVFSNGFDICQRNKKYTDKKEAAICEYRLTNSEETCKSFVMPLCGDSHCNGGLAGCDPLMCFYQQTPPARACSELGAETIFLGYEREGTRYLSEEAVSCDNTVSTVLENVPLGDATPIAVVRGTINPLGFEVPGEEQLLCAANATPPAPNPMPTEYRTTAQTASGSQRNAEFDATVDPFDEVLPGEYCWVIYGEPTRIVAGEGDLAVPSPFVQYLKGAIDPGVRLGLMPPQLPIGCGCLLNPANCENHENGNCDDGIDNDGDGATDYYAPECLKPQVLSGGKTDLGFPFPGSPDFGRQPHLRPCTSNDSG